MGKGNYHSSEISLTEVRASHLLLTSKSPIYCFYYCYCPSWAFITHPQHWKVLFLCFLAFLFRTVRSQMVRNVTSGFMSRQITNEHYKATQTRMHVQAFLGPRADPTVPQFMRWQ